jgi:hypothetical protein
MYQQYFLSSEVFIFVKETGSEGHLEAYSCGSPLMLDAMSGL